MKRTHLGTAIGATAASVAVGMALAGPAAAVSPDEPAVCAGGAASFANNTPLPIPDTNTVVSRDIAVAGVAGTLRDVDVVTSINHTWNGELDIELRHTPPPGGGPVKTVRFVTSVPANRGGNDGFFGTRWDDSALGVVSDQNWAINGSKLNLVPEGAMAALIGDNPNGTWSLRVKDTITDGADVGTLNNWSLDLKTCNQAPSPPTLQNFTGPGGQPIPDAGAGSVVQTLQVSGAQNYVSDLDLLTSIDHISTPGDLQVKLTSPSGTSVWISNRRGNGSQSSLTTRWDDSAPALIVDALWSGGQTRPSLVPEGALGAFIGENPNGPWTLSITDVDPLETGTLNGWSLDVRSTAARSVTPGGGTPGAGPTPIGLPRGPVCRKVNLITTILGAKRGERGDVARIKVKVANKTRNARARAAKAVFKLPAGFTLAGKQKGITLKRGKITASLGIIAGGKAKTKTIKLRAKANAKLGLKTSNVIATALCGSKAKAVKIKLTVAPG
jgi:subtilisin-like proprotein convertase family protein